MTNKRNALCHGLLALLLLQAGLAGAAALDTAKSSIGATFRQLGVDVDVAFRRFSGQITFDPANPAAANAQLTLNPASFDMGDPAYNKEVQKPEWFDSAQFPQATFVSTSIQAAASGKLRAQGKLTIKGRTLDVVVPIVFRQEGKTQVFEGVLPIRRTDFNIGGDDWKDVLDDTVTIRFKAVTLAQ